MAAVQVPASERVTVSMDGRHGYFSEHCIELNAGQFLSYQIESPFPVSFNIHFHSERETLYPVAERTVSSDAGSFDIRVTGQYCFMWTNPTQRVEGFEIGLSYRTQKTGSESEARGRK